MKTGRLLVKNFDARIPKIEIEPRNSDTKIVISSKMYDENDEKIDVKIIFSKVAAIDFQINYFDSMMGAEAFGLFEIVSDEFVEDIINENYNKRKKAYLLDGNYNYDENDPNDMLNILDLSGEFMKEKNQYHAYIQNVDAGVYIIIAKEIQIVR